MGGREGGNRGQQCVKQRTFSSPFPSTGPPAGGAAVVLKQGSFDAGHQLLESLDRSHILEEGIDLKRNTFSSPSSIRVGLAGKASRRPDAGRSLLEESYSAKASRCLSRPHPPAPARLPIGCWTRARRLRAAAAAVTDGLILLPLGLRRRRQTPPSLRPSVVACRFRQTDRLKTA